MWDNIAVGRAGKKERKQNPTWPRIRRKFKKMVDVLEKNRSRPMLVSSVHVEGVQRTKGDLIEKSLHPIMKASTFGEIVESVHNSCKKMEGLGIFSEIAVTLDTSADPFSPENSIDVIIHVKELKRFYLHTGSYVGNQEGSVQTQLVLRNTFGRAERIIARGSMGTKTLGSFLVQFSKPLGGNPNYLFNATLMKQLTNNQYLSSHNENSQGGLLSLKTISRLGSHLFTYEANWRTISQLTPHASFAIRYDSSHSTFIKIK